MKQKKHAKAKATPKAKGKGKSKSKKPTGKARLAARMGLAPDSWPGQVAAMFSAEGLPVSLPDGITFDSLRDQMARDKKQTTTRQVRFALPCAMGDVRLVPIDV